MAARKQKPKPRGASRTSAAPARKSVPGWLLLAGGAAIGGFVAFLALLEPGRPEVKRPPAQPAAASKPAAPAAPQRPKYEFYEELTKSSPPPLPSQQPTAEQVQAAEAARAQALLDGRTPPPRLTASAPANAPQAKQATPPAQTQAQTPAAPQAAAKPAQPSSRFYLQAGSFSSRDQAETTRARLLLLGQDARVESGQAGGKTVHRVVVGPFASRQLADGAQKQLGSNGVSSVVQQRQ